jgi:hypothetical protein
MLGSRARYLEVVLGFWLVASTLVWAYTDPGRVNAWVTGLLIMAMSIAAARWRRTRYGTTLLGAWLVASTWVLPTAWVLTRVHHVVIGMIVAGLSLLGRGRPAELLTTGPLTRPAPDNPRSSSDDDVT